MEVENGPERKTIFHYKQVVFHFHVSSRESILCSFHDLSPPQREAAEVTEAKEVESPVKALFIPPLGPVGRSDQVGSVLAPRKSRKHRIRWVYPWNERLGSPGTS